MMCARGGVTGSGHLPHSVSFYGGGMQEGRGRPQSSFFLIIANIGSVFEGYYKTFEYKVGQFKRILAIRISWKSIRERIEYHIL